jgi:tetratricopeptide (TPR) repeat protein
VRPLRVCVAVLGIAAGAWADTIVLEDGRTFEADEAWYEGQVLRYRHKGQLLELPRDSVARVEPPGTLIDPDVRSSQRRLAEGDPHEALRFARLALFRNPASVTGLEALAAAQLALGEPQRARESARTALSYDPRRPRSLELLGDALSALGDDQEARGHYAAALEIEENRRIRRKLEALGRGQAHVSSARFHIRYEGAADEPLGLAVLAVLDRTWDEYEGRLGCTPDLPVTVVLRTATSFRDTTRTPEWAAALNDGTIRVPVRGVESMSGELVRVLRHELAHSFLADRAGASCPTWLQEGLAQWLEGGDPAREDGRLARQSRAGGLRSLSELEAPFSTLTEAEAQTAYAQSLSVVAHLLRLGGEEGVRRLVGALGEGRDISEALSATYGLDEEHLQRSWRAHLRAHTAAPASAAAGR